MSTDEVKDSSNIPQSVLDAIEHLSPEDIEALRSKLRDRFNAASEAVRVATLAKFIKTTKAKRFFTDMEALWEEIKKTPNFNKTIKLPFSFIWDKLTPDVRALDAVRQSIAHWNLTKNDKNKKKEKNYPPLNVAFGSKLQCKVDDPLLQEIINVHCGTVCKSGLELFDYNHTKQIDEFFEEIEKKYASVIKSFGLELTTELTLVLTAEFQMTWDTFINKLNNGYGTYSENVDIYESYGAYVKFHDLTDKKKKTMISGFVESYQKVISKSYFEKEKPFVDIINKYSKLTTRWNTIGSEFYLDEAYALWKKENN